MKIYFTVQNTIFLSQKQDIELNKNLCGRDGRTICGPHIKCSRYKIRQDFDTLLLNARSGGFANVGGGGSVRYKYEALLSLRHFLLFSDASVGPCKTLLYEIQCVLLHFEQ